MFSTRFWPITARPVRPRCACGIVLSPRVSNNLTMRLPHIENRRFAHFSISKPFMDLHDLRHIEKVLGYGRERDRGAMSRRGSLNHEESPTRLRLTIEW